MKKNQYVLLAGILVCILPLFLFLSKYNQLPDQIPIQFSLSGNVTNTAPKDIFIYAMPAGAILLNIMIYFKNKNKLKENGISWANIIFPLLFLILELVTYYMVLR